MVKGFEVRKANDNGIHVQGANDVVENCVVHDCDDTGIQIGTDVVGSSGMNNTIRNCDSYHNYDAVNGGENADGYGMKESSGTGNRFEGCRAWENADDGYDFYAGSAPSRCRTAGRTGARATAPLPGRHRTATASSWAVTTWAATTSS
jgi:hypothetical protein